MIAVLEDRKGFTKTVWIPYPQPVIRIPLYEPLKWSAPLPSDQITQITSKVLQFSKHRKLDHDEVWLYKEDY